jgi:glyoxylate reductase
MMRWNVFITRRVPDESLDVLRKADVKIDFDSGEPPLPRADLFARIRGCDGVIVTGADPVDGPFFDAAPRLKVVSCLAVGYDNIDIAEASRRRITVTNTPGVLTDACADLAWALILGVARRVVEGDHLARSGEWRGLSPNLLLGVDVAGKTLGIVGAGRIGAAVAKRATGFSMPILFRANRETGNGRIGGEARDLRRSLA